MSNLYNYFVNQKTVSFVSSEFIDNNKVDVSKQQNIIKVQSIVKNILDETYGLLDKSKISKNNINDAIDKFVNVALKRLNIQPRNRNIAAPVSMRMPPQHSTNTRLVPENSKGEGFGSTMNKYMEEYNSFNRPVSGPEIPDFLKSQSTNPKRMMDESLKSSPLDNFKGTATRKNNSTFNDKGSNSEIEDYGGSSNFSFFNDTPEITSAFDDAFYITGIDPDNINENMNESLDERLKKMESARSSLQPPEKKIDSVTELFTNDNEFKKHMNEPRHKNEAMEKKQLEKMYQQQQQYPQQYSPQVQQYPQQPQYQHYQQQEYQDNIIKLQMRENQYQEQLKLLSAKTQKYEEYLKTLMARYTEIKNERDELKHRLMTKPETNMNKINPSLELIEEKKRQLLALSADVQEKISRLEQLQQNTNTTEVGENE
jgi:hypothetical protein